MYNVNSLQGKLDRISELKYLISKVAEVPGDHLSYLEGRSIMQYLIDVKADLERQVRESQTAHKPNGYSSSWFAKND